MLSHYMLSHTMLSHYAVVTHAVSHYAVVTAIIFTRPMPRRELSVLDILKSFAVYWPARRAGALGVVGTPHASAHPAHRT